MSNSRNIDLNHIIYFTFLLMWCVCKARKSPTIDRWKNPCRGERAKDSSIFYSAQEVESRQTLIHKLHIKSIEVLNTVIKLKKIYATQRIRDDDLEMELEFQGWIPGFSSLRHTKLRQGHKSFKKTLIEVYNKTSTAIVFLEQMHSEESAIFTSKRLFGVESRILEKLYSFLCQLHIGIFSENAHIDEYVSKSVMPHEFLWMESESLRYARDFVILRDTLDLFLEFSETFGVHGEYF